MNNTNPDYVYDWAIQQPVVQGFDLSRGNDGHGHQSPIEDSVMEGNTRRYTNPRIRFEFFTPIEYVKQLKRLKDDLGDLVGETYENDTYQMAEGEKRHAHYIDIDGVRYAMHQLRALTTGIDWDGKQVWDGTKHQLGVDGPGHWSYEMIAEPKEGQPRGTIRYTPDPIAAS